MSALVKRECVGRASLQMIGNPRLCGAAAGGLARVLARIVRHEIRAAASPTAAKCVSHTKPVDQIVRTIRHAAASGSIHHESVTVGHCSINPEALVRRKDPLP